MQALYIFLLQADCIFLLRHLITHTLRAALLRIKQFYFLCCLTLMTQIYQEAKEIMTCLIVSINFNDLRFRTYSMMYYLLRLDLFVI